MAPNDRYEFDSLSGDLVFPYTLPSLPKNQQDIWAFKATDQYTQNIDYVGVPNWSTQRSPGPVPRAVYYEFIGSTLVRHEVEYDVQQTLKKIRNHWDLNAAQKEFLRNYFRETRHDRHRGNQSSGMG